MEPTRTPHRGSGARAVDRNNDLAAIHIRATKCGLIIPARDGLPKNDDDYRALVRTLSNNVTDSAAKLDHAQRAALLAHLGRLERATGHSGPLPQWRKLRALWAELHACARVAADTEAAMNAWCARQLGGAAKSSARWYGNDELRVLIEAAKRWLARQPR